MSTKTKTPNSKNIIYFGDFSVSYSTELYISRAFTELGYRVLKLQESDVSINNLSDVINEILMYEPEFILFSKGKLGGKFSDLMDALKFNKIKTVCWIFDLYFGLNSIRVMKIKTKEPPFNSDYLISTDGGHQKEFEELGYKHHCIRQGIYEPEAVFYDLPKKYEIIFVGADHFKNRGWLFDGLSERYGNKFNRFGFPTQIRGLALNELYGSTKIVVGDSQPSPRYWSNRIYETLGRGGFLIHPRVEGLEEEFEDGKHLVLYDRGNIEQLCKIIDHYLTHNEEREKIRRAGFEKVKKDYTYKKRCQELLKIIKSEQ